MRFLLLALLLLSAASFGGTKVTPNVGSNMSILNSNNTGYLSGTNYWKQGDTVTSYMERLGRHTPIGVTPSRGVPTGRIASSVKDMIRLSPAAIVSSVGLMAIVDAAGWAVDELTGQITKEQRGTIDEPTFALWTSPHYEGRSWPSAVSACRETIAHIDSLYYHGLFVYDSVNLYSQTAGACRARNVNSGYTNDSLTSITRVADCPTGADYDGQIGVCVTDSVQVPVSQNDLDTLDLSGGDAAFYDGLMRDACNLSSSPSNCFDSLVDHHKLDGPSTVSGPKTTTTSTQTNLDGTTTTVEKETQTDFDIAYGDDDFVYTPRTTTETKVDGQTTETTTEQEDTDADSEQKPEEEAVSEIAGLQCEAAVSCSGDAIQCAIAKTQKDTKCILQDAFDYSSQKTDVETVFQGDEYVIEDEEIDIPSFIGQGARFLPATCPAPIPMSLSGKTYSLDTQPFCTFATDLSFLIVAFATLAAALYIGRAFGGE
tara:strand:- start:5498 stop:6952 length:1455 start_codon:yes stop_codon:yes gene_type:complete